MHKWAFLAVLVVFRAISGFAIPTPPLISTTEDTFTYPKSFDLLSHNSYAVPAHPYLYIGEIFEPGYKGQCTEIYRQNGFRIAGWGYHFIDCSQAKKIPGYKLPPVVEFSGHLRSWYPWGKRGSDVTWDTKGNILSRKYISKCGVTFHGKTGCLNASFYHSFNET